MEKFWTDATKSKLYKNWIGGIATGLFFKGGLYNSEPMKDFLKNQFKDVNMQRMLDIGIVDVKDGSYVPFNENNIVTQAKHESWKFWSSKKKAAGNEKLVDALYASMSFAGFFPPAEVLDSYYFDGSAVWDIDIFTAINRCSEKGFKN